MGPDADFMQDILTQLGVRHKKMGVKANFIPYMGDSIIDCLQTTLGESFTETHRDAWNKVYDAISSEIIKSILA